MAARKKPSFTPIKNLDEFNIRLSEVAELDREITTIDYELNELIDQAKTEAEQAAKPHKDKRDQLDASLAAYAEYNKSVLFTDKKTIELLFGSFGFRKSSAIKNMKGFKIADIVLKIKELGLRNAITVKESLNKDVMSEWADQQLEAVGAMREEKDTFWYEVKEEKV